ncbi:MULTISPECIES: gephyrin-like molybdotransferase Glp [Corynebacterium]|uniref:Molybdopterin molybdenumtransferase n=1 Tax=Corynebacterium freneyi TaxID=134034 RepID=A0ABS4U5A0_9CORY|nr:MULTISPECIES: gephyrin-like molybdotransferase Glp [Corynebacterium]MBP2331842.1 molybdopterin molybdotransferase [Corynebacterium freneyi]MCG7439583.1 molybdopterin molybdotransferase MoeA [Corynebacterium freneyi]OFU53976.1 molybdopterin molybdenumtransferase [Corynebacterium sp. HMSC11E11]QXA53880.1 molybdopterin molybdotransferase MoeA [Corynebacterium freneyi]UBI01920.1 molybdopterin molybdotransferase MoeA [Corynebacterium freneyi]
MRSVEEQLATITANAAMPAPVRIAISESLGLLCAEDVVAETPLPGFVQSAIDGYAVRAVDVRGDSGETLAEFDEVTLPVVGEVSAGSHHPMRLQPKQAVRVHTGAPLPTLADAVLPLDWSDRGERRVTALRAVKSGDFVRRVGDDIQPGDVAVSAGAVISPAQVGLLAAVGRSKVLVHPRPRMSVVSIGAELVDVDREPGLGQVYDVNSYALAAAGRDAGAEVHRVGIAAGEPRRIREIIEGQLIKSELLVITGAVGGAAGDEVRRVLSEMGEIDVERVAMHPGSVQGFGLLGDDRIPTFLLPSNPVSAMVVFEVMVRPLIRIALGKSNPRRRTVPARAIAPVDSVAGRRGLIRGQLMRDRETSEYLVQPFGGATGAQAHLLAGLAEANCLVVVPDDVTHVRPGDIVDVLFLARQA